MTEPTPQQPGGNPPQWTPPGTDAAPTASPDGAPTTPPPGVAPTAVLSPPPPPPAAFAPAPKKKDRRATLAATALVGALVLGGGAGFGGAALFYSTQDDATRNGGNSATGSQVVDSNAPQGTAEKVASKVLPSVVKIEVAGQAGSGSGSGIILSSDGLILTNNHVVDISAESSQNGQPGIPGAPGQEQQEQQQGSQDSAITVDFSDGTKAKAKVVGTDPLTDTAVIQAEGVSGLTPATIGKSSKLVVGQDVVAIGSPYGLDSTVTTGIVSALDRPVNVGSDSSGNATVYPAIQTDAAINPGNSGGALVDMNGNVVGINASIRSNSSSSEEAGSIGLGFAIPIDEVLPIIDQLKAGDDATHARMGISVGDSGASESGESSVTGATVQEVTKDSAAEKAGLKKGDTITKVDEHQINGSDSLVATVRSYRPGDDVEVTWSRDGKEQSAKITLDSDAT